MAEYPSDEEIAALIAEVERGYAALEAAKQQVRVSSPEALAGSGFQVVFARAPLPLPPVRIVETLAHAVKRQSPHRGPSYGIETEYRGITFASRGEARWAVVFDELGVEAVYQPFELRGYIPDFSLPDRVGGGQVLVEVKGGFSALVEFSDAMEKAERALRDSVSSEHDFLFLPQAPWDAGGEARIGWVKPFGGPPVECGLVASSDPPTRWQGGEVAYLPVPLGGGVLSFDEIQALWAKAENVTAY